MHWLLMEITKNFTNLILKKTSGTGNDLSRELGWTGGYTVTGDIGINHVLKQIQKAERVYLDRWEVKIGICGKRFFDYKRKLKSTLINTKFMNNYISVGCDALATLNFHQSRYSLPFSNRLLNKVKNISAMQNISVHLSLHVDPIHFSHTAIFSFLAYVLQIWSH
jgi:hypothetical protein